MNNIPMPAQHTQAIANVGPDADVESELESEADPERVGETEAEERAAAHAQDVVERKKCGGDLIHG